MNTLRDVMKDAVDDGSPEWFEAICELGESEDGHCKYCTKEGCHGECEPDTI